MEGAHLQCVNNYYAKFEYKEMNTVRVIMQSLNIKECKLLELQITQTRRISDGKMSKFNSPKIGKY